MTKKEATEQIDILQEMGELVQDYQELLHEIMNELETPTTSNE